jgi:pimeloyl-ACP methyl ester carboxylesterase
MDLPSDDESARWSDYVDAVVEAIGDRSEIVIVAQSFGGFVAPLVPARLPIELIVLVAAMVPAPGERADEWWANTGYGQAAQEQAGDDEGAAGDEIATFYQDVDPALAAEALSKGRDQADVPEPLPLEAWPNVPTRFLLCLQDRMFPAAWLRQVVRERLGFEPDEIDCGHTPALSRPQELTARLEAYRAEL